VWVAGQQLLDGGRPMLADSGSILARAAAWGNKLQNGHD
jgi:hypothetical protein